MKVKVRIIKTKDIIAATSKQLGQITNDIIIQDETVTDLGMFLNKVQKLIKEDLIIDVK